MSTLKTIEKQYFEDLFGMGSGYVLDFSNQSFAALFRGELQVEIDDPKYCLNGDSKAKRLRSFWEQESDALVGKALSELLEYWCYKNPEPSIADQAKLEQCRRIIERLTGKSVAPQQNSEEQFLRRDFKVTSLRNLQIEASLLPILEARFDEAIRCLKSDAPLAAIFLSGSILEGLLLGLASRNSQQFNQAASSPKDRTSGIAKPFQDWSLSNFIDVAHELGYLKLDVKKFGHTLREFRNYIHPFQQLTSRFTPDRHTAEICLQVLKAAIASLSGER